MFFIGLIICGVIGFFLGKYLSQLLNQKSVGILELAKKYRHTDN